MAKGTPGCFDVDERLAVLSAKGDDLERVKALIDFNFERRWRRQCRVRIAPRVGARPSIMCSCSRC
jgi:IS5 family transposase